MLGIGEIRASVSASCGPLIDSTGELDVLCPLSGESPEMERAGWPWPELCIRATTVEQGGHSCAKQGTF